MGQDPVCRGVPRGLRLARGVACTDPALPTGPTHTGHTPASPTHPVDLRGPGAGNKGGPLPDGQSPPSLVHCCPLTWWMMDHSAGPRCPQSPPDTQPPQGDRTYVKHCNFVACFFFFFFYCFFFFLKHGKTVQAQRFNKPALHPWIVLNYWVPQPPSPPPAPAPQIYLPHLCSLLLEAAHSSNDIYYFISLLLCIISLYICLSYIHIGFERLEGVRGGAGEGGMEGDTWPQAWRDRHYSRSRAQERDCPPLRPSGLGCCANSDKKGRSKGSQQQLCTKAGGQVSAKTQRSFGDRAPFYPPGPAVLSLSDIREASRSLVPLTWAHRWASHDHS